MRKYSLDVVGAFIASSTTSHEVTTSCRVLTSTRAVISSARIPLRAV